MSSAEAPPDSVVVRAAAGYRSSLFSHVIRIACKAVGIVVLARLVAPAQHGLFAMAASVFFVLVLFRDLGLGSAAIQARDLTEEQRTTLWLAHAALGLLLGGAMLALAPAVALFFNDAQLTPLVATMSAALVLIGLNTWPRVLLARDLRFAELNRIETWAAVIGTVAMIATALLDGGAYAFVAFLLVSESVCLIGAWRVCGWRSTAPARWLSIRPLWRPASDLLAYNVLQCILTQIDTVLMGGWFGAGAAGLYNRPNQLLALPVTHIASPLTQVLAASLSRLSPASPDFSTAVRHAANLLAHLTLPLAVLCIAVPHDIVRLLLGPDWTDAAPLLRWLAVSAAASYLTVTVYAVCFAIAKTQRLVLLTVGALVTTSLALWLARPYGPVGLAMALAVVNLLFVFPRLAAATWKTPLALRDYFSALAGPLALALLFALALTTFHRITADFPWAFRFAVTTSAALGVTSLIALSIPSLRSELQRIGQLRSASHAAAPRTR